MNFSCDQAVLRTLQSVCPSVCPSVFLSLIFHNVAAIVSPSDFQELLQMTKVMSMQRVKVKGQGHRGQNPIQLFTDRNSSLNSHMMVKWCTKLDVDYRCPIDFQEHPSNFNATQLWNVDFDPNWAFPDCNSSLNSSMATKWCTKLEAA